MMLSADFEISTDRSRIDVDLVHEFLSTASYWAKGRPRALVERTIANSLCFGIYRSGQQVAFGRVLTDYAIIGYIADLFVVPAWRGQGIGKALVRAMVEHPDIAGLQVVLLRSTDARSLYAQFGFAAVPAPEELRGRYRSAARPAVAADGASLRR
jgi:GNAT superfamily N-acetyltransferase